MRWDYADKSSYYDYTDAYLSPVSAKLNCLMGYDEIYNNTNILIEAIDTIYDETVCVLQSASTLFVPHHSKFFNTNFGGTKNFSC